MLSVPRQSSCLVAIRSPHSRAPIGPYTRSALPTDWLWNVSFTGEQVYQTAHPLMEWSGRGPAPPAIEAGEGRQRQAVMHTRLPGWVNRVTFAMSAIRPFILNFRHDVAASQTSKWASSRHRAL